MSIHVAINHKTHYRYAQPVALTPHIFRLRPAPHSRTPIEAYSLTIRPQPHFINWQQDAFGNFLARVVFPEKVAELYIEVDVIADMTVINPFDFFVEEYAERYPFAYSAQERKELAPYLEIAENGPRLLAWLAAIDRTTPTPIIDFLVAINQRLWRTVGYNIRMDPGVQSCETTLGDANGSCRDSAWVLVQALRHLGLAARFASGYLVQLTADQPSLDGPSGPTTDFTDLHAWAEVYIPGAGWIGLDATSGLFAGEGHIPLACTPDPVSAAPVSGGVEPVATTFEFSNTVQRIHEDPRVTLPYTDEQWAAIDALGLQIDGQFALDDVRLTMGGEPTFVSIDDMEAKEWNISADGPHKRALANDLVQRLRAAFGPGGLLHYGQGKWYPGEPLPRWKLAALWRTDGVPIWHNDALFADVHAGYGHDHATAAYFARQVARRLGLAQEFVMPAYEDIFYFLWQEGQIPVNVDPLAADLSDTGERRKLAQLLEQGMDAPVGYVLPVRWNTAGDAWESAAWPLRRKQLFLVPGDSPMGLRLPLDTLPEPEEDEEEPYVERDPFAEVGALGDYYAEMMGGTEIKAEAKVKAEAEGVMRTALCVEVREGRLHLFMPPLAYLEHYLRLVAAIEHTAAELQIPIVLEGYEPPHDRRLQRILVTPDPGVIEVNIHPSASWPELVDNTIKLYEQAREARLGTEKFMVDGRHTGTGGGNHVTMGGLAPEDSPFLRRPDLLRSLITYWQHHPGLSYLFSGMFIGPTSQAPRVDEGLVDHLYELEIAFQQIPEPGTPVPPWVVDRILRNLLTDLTGNTHRAEFCIDKLYSPDSAGGRLGILEFRAFDMPPHARMSLAQTLLLRALIARFWRAPYTHKLIRWGTELHDRFLLPHFVAADLAEVVEDLQAAGYGYQFEWLAPFFEFRFPRYGTVNIRDIEMELRFAIEPWNVLGEEAASQGTARYVDSSVERLQVKITGLHEGRYALACNGRQLPLRATGTVGEYVAGVRYQAWQPSSALHPTMGVHSPLVFDIVDLWHNRSIGGCTYHVVHAGGRSYDDIPVNANVAEARRVSRFWNHGHTPASGAFVVGSAPQPIGRTFMPEANVREIAALPPREINAEFPSTLDLRWNNR